MTAETIIFSGNIDKDTGSSGEKYGGGALYQRSSSGATIVMGKEGGTVTFSDNKSNTIGGAIGIRATDGKTSLITLKSNTIFENNTSKLSGGVIWNKAEGAGTASNIVFEDAVTFTNNKAGVDLEGQAVDGSTAKGGAICNEYSGIIGNITGNFEGNYAAGSNGDGGAIHNFQGTINNIIGNFKNNLMRFKDLSEISKPNFSQKDNAFLLFESMSK